jgi:large subunit ribosomal protein L21
MANIAVIKLSGSQHLVKAGEKLEVNKLAFDVNKDQKAEVLLSTKGETMLLNDGEVIFKVLENKKGEKLHIVKFRAKSRYRRRVGHRQQLSLVEIVSINGELKSEKETKVEAKATEAKPAKKAVAKAPVKKEAKKATVKKPAVKKGAKK